MAGLIPCPCNKCIPCLINRKRLWTHRILLESYSHDYSSFITLTYTDDKLNRTCPETSRTLPSPSLHPKDLQKFIKRIRRASAPNKLRFYAVGEYGDRTWRPHYHLALFGYEPCWYGTTKKDKHSQGRSCCPPCDLIYEKWGKGGIDNARVENDSAGYIAGYVTKKLTKKDDQRLKGRYPEFSRMSRRPGIGAKEIDKVADAIFSQHGKHALTEHGDVPVSLTHGTKSMPLGRYLRDQIRKEIGSDDTPQEMAKTAYLQELHTMWADHIKDPNIPKEQKLSLKHFLKHQNEQKILNIETKHDLTKRKKLL
jgi:hypothetical protein